MQENAGVQTALAPASAAAPGLGSDPHDFAGLYIRHRASFTSHARRYLRDGRDADEVVQEAFLRLFLAMPELDNELQALAYCRRTITNLCIDRYRADARRPRLVALDGAPIDELAEDDAGDPVVRAEDAALVRAALSQLPELHRAALVKREIEEKSLPVIADELDVAEDNVKHLLFRARRTLRKLLAGTSVAPGADAERARGLRPAGRGLSGGVAGLLLAALVGLGSGPDLRAVPVVGVDLPDVLGVTAVADAVTGAVREVVGAVLPGNGSEATAAERETSTSPVGRSRDLTPGQTGQPQGAGPVTGTTEVATSAGRAPAVGRAPVGSALPPAAPGASAPVAGGRPGASGTAPAPGPVQLPQGAAQPPSNGPSGGGAGSSSAVPGAAAKPPAAPVTGSTGRAPRPVEVPVVGRGPVAVPGGTADRAADKAADMAAKAAEKAAQEAGKAADKAQQAAEKVEKAAEKVAEKADRAADGPAGAGGGAGVGSGKAAEKAAERAADKAEQSTDKAEKAAQKAADAAERAVDKAAKERGPAEQAASQRVVAPASVHQAVTTAVPVDAAAPVPAP